MKGIEKRISAGNLFFLCLCVFLIVGFLSLISCSSKEKAEEVAQQDTQIQDLQAKVNGLQKDVAAKDAEINQLKSDNEGLKRRIPLSWEVQEGDSHWRIAYDYLTEKRGLSDEDARAVLRDIPLADQILVGFKVGNYSDGIDYASFLAQGEAALSPGDMQRIEQTNIEAEKVKLRNKIAEERIKGQEENAGLKDNIRELENEYKTLKSHSASLKEKATEIQSQNKDFESKLNSVYYIVGTKSGLKAKGKASLGEVSFADLQNRIDLREVNVIELNAGDVGISTIKKVTLLPKNLDGNRDYRVEISGGGQSAKVHLLNKDKFCLARIIIVVS
ncbi:MAG: hypothetical protein HQ555_06950 [Candidatus Aminicenantes bacterium]|nr:hypothetical protein [Candidatus Aminicenantes bacterium]